MQNASPVAYQRSQPHRKPKIRNIVVGAEEIMWSRPIMVNERRWVDLPAGKRWDG